VDHEKTLFSVEFNDEPFFVINKTLEIGWCVIPRKLFTHF